MDEEDDVCPICFDTLLPEEPGPSDLRLAGDCGHCFHRECLQKYQNSAKEHATCPTCRQELFPIAVRPRPVQYIGADEEPPPATEQQSGAGASSSSADGTGAAPGGTTAAPDAAVHLLESERLRELKKTKELANNTVSVDLQESDAITTARQTEVQEKQDQTKKFKKRHDKHVQKLEEKKKGRKDKAAMMREYGVSQALHDATRSAREVAVGDYPEEERRFFCHSADLKWEEMRMWNKRYADCDGLIQDKLDKKEELVGMVKFWRERHRTEGADLEKEKAGIADLRRGSVDPAGNVRAKLCAEIEEAKHRIQLAKRGRGGGGVNVVNGTGRTGGGSSGSSASGAGGAASSSSSGTVAAEIQKIREQQQKRSPAVRKSGTKRGSGARNNLSAVGTTGMNTSASAMRGMNSLDLNGAPGVPNRKITTPASKSRKSPSSTSSQKRLDVLGGGGGAATSGIAQQFLSEKRQRDADKRLKRAGGAGTAAARGFSKMPTLREDDAFQHRSIQDEISSLFGKNGASKINSAGAVHLRSASSTALSSSARRQLAFDERGEEDSSFQKKGGIIGKKGKGPSAPRLQRGSGLLVGKKRGRDEDSSDSEGGSGALGKKGKKGGGMSGPLHGAKRQRLNVVSQGVPSSDVAGTGAPGRTKGGNQKLPTYARMQNR